MMLDLTPPVCCRCAKEYMSVWCALDDMSEENGTLYIAPGSANSPRPPSTEEGTYVLCVAIRVHRLAS